MIIRESSRQCNWSSSSQAGPEGCKTWAVHASYHWDLTPGSTSSGSDAHLDHVKHAEWNIMWLKSLFAIFLLLSPIPPQQPLYITLGFVQHFHCHECLSPMGQLDEGYPLSPSVILGCQDTLNKRFTWDVASKCILGKNCHCPLLRKLTS